MNTVNSTSDERTINNVMRHGYRVLSDDEKAAMQTIKDIGLAFHEYLDTLRTPPSEPDENGMSFGVFDREITIAQQKIEEAVMWAVKHITA